MDHRRIKEQHLNQLTKYVSHLHKNPRLIYLFWEAAANCNMNCLHCGSNCSATGNKDILSEEEMEAFFRELANGFNAEDIMICVTGGEPLLREDLFSIMGKAVDLGFSWGMTSNGFLISDHTIAKMQRAKMSTISISVDGLEQDHNWLRQTECFDEVIKNIRKLVQSEAFYHVQITSVIHKNNINALDDMYHYFSNLGIDSWRLTNIEPIGRANQNEALLLDAKDYIKLFNFIREKRETLSALPVLYGCSHYLTLEYEGEVRDNYFLCGAGVYVAGILQNGDIYACPDIERRADLIQGNIRNDSFKDVWFDGFGRFRENRYLLNGTCRSCPVNQFCRGDSIHTWDFGRNAPKVCLRKMFERKEDGNNEIL